MTCDTVFWPICMTSHVSTFFQVRFNQGTDLFDFLAAFIEPSSVQVWGTPSQEDPPRGSSTSTFGRGDTYLQ